MTNNTFGGEKAFAAVWIEIRCAAQTGLMQMQLLLTQHLLAVAARNIRYRSIFAKAAVQTDQLRRISN